MSTMKKNVLVLLIAASLFAFNSGCTSKESTGDEQAVENADIEKIESIDGDVAPAETTETIDDSSLEASLNDPATETTADVPTIETTTDPSTASVVDETNLNATTDVPPTVTDAQLAPDPSLEASTPPPETTLTETPITETPVAETVTETPSEPEVQPTPVAKPVSSGPTLKKVSAVAPYQSKNGGWVNTVYIVHPDEKLEDISQKIFGSDKTDDLKAVSENKYLKSRSVKAGDKIYYVSPNRPDDSTRTITYFEDMGMVPETYVAKKGESLKKVAKNLLGYDNAWREIWSTNAIESKTTLKDGDTIRFWKAGAEMMTATVPSPPPSAYGATVTTESPTATATTTPPAADYAATQPTLPPPPADSNESLPPPPTEDASASLPPPPPSDEPPPPPPPVEEAVETAATTDDDKPSKKIDLDAEAEEEEGEVNSDTLMSLGALGVLIALLAFVIIRKRKQKSQVNNNLEMNA